MRLLLGLLSVVAVEGCTCGPCESVSASRQTPCMLTDGGVGLNVLQEWVDKPAGCSVERDGGVLTFSANTTVCPHLLGESWPHGMTCDLTAVPAGTYLVNDDARTPLTLPLPADAGLRACQ